MPLKKLLLKSGVNKENTRYTNENGWYISDKVRFRQGTAGTANTGGGGGGRHDGTGGAGGSGVVILRYVTAEYSGTRTETGSPSVTTSGIYTILTFNTSGTVTFGV